MEISTFIFYAGIEAIVILALCCLLLIYLLFKTKKEYFKILKEPYETKTDKPLSIVNIFSKLFNNSLTNHAYQLKTIFLEQKDTISILQTQLDKLSQHKGDSSLQNFVDEQNNVINNHEITINRLKKELESSTLKVCELKATLNKNDLISGSEEDLRTIIQRFTVEIKELMSCIYTLEKENNSLKQKLNMTTFEIS